MLDFCKQRGYPLVHQVLAKRGKIVTYQYTHTEEPRVGDPAVSMLSGAATLISVDRIEEARSPHHTEPVKLYTCTFELEHQPFTLNI